MVVPLLVLALCISGPCLLYSLRSRDLYRRALKSVIKGVQKTEPHISRSVKTQICVQATADKTEHFLNGVVKDVTEGA